MPNRTFRIKIKNDFEEKCATFECQDGVMKPPRKRHKKPGKPGQMTVENAPDKIELKVTPENESTAYPNKIKIKDIKNCESKDKNRTDHWVVEVKYTGQEFTKDKKKHKIKTNEAQTNVTVTDKQRQKKKPKKGSIK